VSIFLYRLGGAIARRAVVVLGVWVLIFAGLVGANVMLGDHYNDTFTLPGTQSQEGQDLLAARFGLTGTSGQIYIGATSGKITDSANAKTVSKISSAVDHVEHVSMSDPLKASPPLVSKDSRSTIGTVQFASQVPSDATLAAVEKAADPGRGADVRTSVGGNAYKATSDPSKVPELLGLAISFVILALTFGSLLTAGMPILTSLIGVGVTLSAVVLTSWQITVSSTSPTLAEMLGLAVGIDYALFLLSRYRAQLGEGVSTTEAMSRALATAGSAVVFAGATVVIALSGLSVAGIPVLTVMGLAAAAAVTMAVLIALTLLPAIALLLGERLRPKPRRRRRREVPKTERKGFAHRWVRGVTRWPILTVVAVMTILVLAAVPATRLDLALPDNSTAPLGSAPRTTYDDITKSFGAGYNSPLAVTANVIKSSNPKDTVQDLAKGIEKVPGVVAVPQATPNQAADTAIVQVIPEGGQTAPSTAALVKELRARTPSLEKKYKVQDILVAGPTAINIDVSERLGSSLLPFAAIVIGLSLLLLMVVFRSLAVPVKATLGYLLSVGAALGSVVVVFQLGWLDGVLPGISNGPIVSFLPIFVMGVLFGLAMDYEMFLVSAMREEFVTTGDARQAVYGGFRASSRVVTAAALIMTSVFLAFIPGGSSTIQPIALGLAVGVLADAFLVRMTWVPAVLALLGRHAWQLPGWLDRALPVVDVEGAALHRRVAFEDWATLHGETVLLARDLVVQPGDTAMQLSAGPGELLRLSFADPAQRRAVGQVLVGRQAPVSGELVLAGFMLPEERGSVTRTATLVEVSGAPAIDVRPLVAERAELLSWLPRRRRELAARVEAVLGDLTGTSAFAASRTTGTVRPWLAEVAMAVATGARLVVLLPPPFDEVPASYDVDAEIETATALLASEGVTVVLLTETPASGGSPHPERVPTGVAAVVHTEEM
jgi:putative drug exporter of the RND superfamily